MSKRHDYSINHWCGLLPDMKPRAFAELKDDIELYGLKDKIELLNLEVVDGRHRLRALQELGIELSDEHFVHLDPKTDARAHVSSKNLKRRHLSTGAKAELARKFSQGSTRGGDRRSKKQRDIRHSCRMVPTQGPSPRKKPPRCGIYRCALSVRPGRSSTRIARPRNRPKQPFERESCP